MGEDRRSRYPQGGDMEMVHLKNPGLVDEQLVEPWNGLGHYMLPIRCLGQ